MNTTVHKGLTGLNAKFCMSGIGCRIAATVAAVAVALPLFAERQPFDRYQSIVDRQMFGQPPPGFDPTKPPSEVSAKEERAKEQELTKEQEQLKSAIHFSMINETPAGETAVGFTDNSDAKNPKHYYLKVGESRDGWTVKEADALKAEMTVVKGEIEVTLTIGGNSANGGTKKAGMANGLANGRRGAGSPTVVGRPNLLGARGSLRERRMMREQQKAEAAKAAAEEKAKAAEREAQREAERAAEKAEREKEREEQRAQLLQIQEELKKAREEKAKAESEARKDDDEKGENGE